MGRGRSCLDLVLGPGGLSVLFQPPVPASELVFDDVPCPDTSRPGQMAARA